MADLVGIKAKFQTIELVESITGQAAKGPDGQGRYMARCPFHEDDTPSLRVMSDGGYVCFACGAKGGDVIDFVAAQRGISVADAIAALESESGTPPPRPARSGQEVRAPAVPEIVARPIPAEIEHRVRETGTIALHYPTREKPEIVKPAKIYAYRKTAGGEASHLVLRIERDGRKVFRPACWDGSQWWGVAQPTPRPLYGLETLETGTQVLVVEGEKAADAARERLPAKLSVVSWQGGASSHPTADWDVLAGRSVVVWPDADEPGIACANAIADRLQRIGCRVRIVDVEGLPKGWDAADLDPAIDMLGWLKDRLVTRQDAPSEAERDTPPEETEAGVPDQGELAQAVRDTDFPFTILGQSGNDCFFLKHADGRICHYPLTSLVRREVLGVLAPPTVWQRAFGGADTDGRPIGWPTIGSAAQAHIVAACERRPSFDPDRLRGRGCWPHRGGVAFHRGDWTEVNGRRQTGNLVDGIIYESLPPLDSEIEDQLLDSEGRRLIDLIKACSWAEPSSGTALAGWIALAPICGALSWRPHVWITGPSGSGKTTIMHEIVYPSVSFAVRVDGNTSEAGLRQAIGRDALPVLLDEAEPDAKSMRGILDLARSASTGDTIVRGTPGGGAQYFHARSAFCFSAINPAIAKRADESRISRLELRIRNDDGADAHFRRLRDSIAELVRPGFGARLAARSIALAGMTLSNIQVMEDAIAQTYGSRRLAQQWGALIAGAYSLVSREAIGEERALRLAKTVPMESAKAQTEETDSRAMLMHLCSYQIEVTSKHGRIKMSVAELIERLMSRFYDQAEQVGRLDAEQVLSRWGIKVDRTRKEVSVAVNFTPIRNSIFRDTDWQHSYTLRLRELPGARSGGQARFGGVRCSSTVVPSWHFVGVADEEELGEDGPGLDQGDAADGVQSLFPK